MSSSVFASAVRRGGGFTIIAALVLGAFSGCGDSPAAPPTSIPVEFRISAGVGEGDPGRSVVVDAYYRRTGGDEIALAVDPATIDVETGSIAAGTVTVDVLPCVRDTSHEPMSGSSADGCRVYLVARLLAPNGTPVSEEEITVPVARSVRSVIVDAFELPSGALVPSAASVDLVAGESGQLPAPATVTVASSTALAGGALSATVEYLSGAGWLTVTIPAGSNSVTIAPASATLAPGAYEAIVRVTSARMFEPAAIAVHYEVPHPPKSVTITGAGNGTGLVLVTPNGASCTTTAGQLSGICTVPAPHGSFVELTAAPAVGSGFTGWAGACQGTGSCILTMDQSRAVTATFTILKWELTVHTAGAGSGTVTSSPAGISCTSSSAQPGICMALFDHPTQVTLTATPNSATSTFTGWSGACQGTGACVVTMSEARSVTATFGLIQRSLTLTVAGEGTGTVTSSPAGIECALAGQTSKICTGSFDHGTVVSLMASPGTGMTFTGWSGACTGTGSCAVTMDAARSVTATIVPPSHTLTVTAVGNGMGSVGFNPARAGCFFQGSGGSCTREFPAGSVVEVHATLGNSLGTTALSGCVFIAAPSQSAACRITMDGPKTVTVNFNSPSTQAIVLGAGTGSGTVVGSGISCTIVAGQTSGACGTTETFGMLQPSLEFTATPAPGSLFGGWIGCPSPSGTTCRVGSYTRATVTVVFTLSPPEPSLFPMP